MRIIRNILDAFFQLLYHSFAWAYDLVATVVSLGRWESWVLQAQPFVSGRVLEIGFGPGHLQMSLHAGGLEAFGLDESRQMSRQAGHRLRRKGYPVRLLRGMAQQIPFPDGAFDGVVTTFPSEYIFEAQTLAEIRRVLRPGGKLVIVPSAWITGKGLLERLAAGLFQATGQAGMLNAVLPGMKQRIGASGFLVRHKLVELNGSRVLVIIATI
jgi:ubiquinone/menaquinone biosynthesis C-methylase UbiE